MLLIHNGILSIMFRKDSEFFTETALSGFLLASYDWRGIYSTMHSVILNNL